jgi:hypothetical protein
MIGGEGDEAEDLARQQAELERQVEELQRKREALAKRTNVVQIGSKQVTIREVDPTSVSVLDELGFIHAMNQKHVVIGNIGGKYRIMDWVESDVDPGVLIPTYQTKEDFKSRYNDEWVTTKDGAKKAGDFWLRHKMKAKYNGVGFEPGEGLVLVGDRLNLWRGYAVKAKPGKWPRLRWHIEKILANGDSRAAEYILRWLTWTLQNPGKPAEVVLVFQSDAEGTGKGTIAKVMLKIFGTHGLPVSDAKHLTGDFSGQLHHCCFLFIDEAFWAGDQKGLSRFKNLITEEQITIEPKNITAFKIRNMLHIMMASNNSWVIPAGLHDRRFSMNKVSDAKVEDKDYFDALYDELDNGGRQAFLHDMLAIPLKGWHPKQVYKTEASVEQKQHSLRGLDEWMETILQSGVLPGAQRDYPNRSLMQDLEASARGFDRYTNKTQVGNYIRKHFQQGMEQLTFNRNGLSGRCFPSLAECRKAWETRVKSQWPWLNPEISTWQPDPLACGLLDRPALLVRKSASPPPVRFNRRF